MSAEATDVSAGIQQSVPAGNSAPASTQDRLKAFLGASDPAPADQAQPKAASDPVNDGKEGALPGAEPVPAKSDQAEASGDDGQSGDDAQAEEWQPSSVDELIEALGWESEKLLGLPAKVKIDGKEGTATIRDLIKSYQLDGHINQKLQSLDTDRKTFEGKRQEFERERADKLLRMDAGLKTLERSLMGEFAAVDWQKLATENPHEYNARLVQFQQHNAHLQDIAQQIATEQQQHQQQAQAQAEAQLEEERKLALAKIPEWTDEKVRDREHADIIGYLDSLGLDGKQAFGSLGDHRHLLVVRAAWQWDKLQKSKPAVLNKVRTAPKLLKPGSQQSKDASASLSIQKDHARLKQTGRISDAASLLKARLFG